MKKLSFLYLAVVLAALSSFLYTSCKKILHSNAPTPGNIRLMSYTATTRLANVVPIPQADTTNDSYTFTYDGNNRVIQIMYTTSNLTFFNATGLYSERITFHYSNDTVIKTTASVNGTPVFEIDTFIVDPSTNLISTTYTPGLVTTYEYYGKLLARQSSSFYNGNNSLSESRIYNSDNGDFLNYSFNGTLTATFTNTLTVTPYPMRDYWSSNPNGILGNVIAIHNGITTYTDVLTGYTDGLPVTVFAKDTANDTALVSMPGNYIWPQESYTFYTTMANRIGDYLQLNSFTQWGNNLYQNSHLVKSITDAGYTTNVTYNIDAYSKITQITAVIADSLANTRSITYNLQYEKY